MRALPAALCVAALLLAAGRADAQQWATVKGQVVFAEDKVPARQPLDVNKDQEHCLSRGPILAEQWVVDSKTKGVKNVVVFLKPADNPDGPFPTGQIHPELAEAGPMLEIDQPCCMYEPRVVIGRAGQKFVAKNSSPIAHNVKYASLKNGQGNPLVPAGQETVVSEALQPDKFPMKLECSIHPWMTGYMWAFDHPYAVLTNERGEFVMVNAPAGKYRLVVWHEAAGYRGGKAGRDGEVIEIKPGENDLGKIDLKESYTARPRR